MKPLLMIHIVSVSCFINHLKINNMFALQHKEPYPPAILKQLRPDQMLKNNTNQPERWREVKFCEDIEPLKKYVINENYRIVNWENLEIAFRYRS